LIGYELLISSQKGSQNTGKHGLKKTLLISETNVEKCRVNNIKSIKKMGYFEKNYIVNKINFDDMKSLYL